VAVLRIIVPAFVPSASKRDACWLGGWGGVGWGGGVGGGGGLGGVVAKTNNTKKQTKNWWGVGGGGGGGGFFFWGGGGGGGGGVFPWFFVLTSDPGLRSDVPPSTLYTALPFSPPFF